MLSPALLLLTLAAAPAEPARLVFGGDVIPHDPVKHVARLHARGAPEEPGASTNHEGWDHVFGPLAPALRRAQLAVVNLETPVTTLAQPARGALTFNAPPGLLKGLAAAGVTAATFANNHVLDQGREGVVETRRRLDAVGLLTAGAAANRAQAWTPLVVELPGLSVGVVAMTRWLNGRSNGVDPGAPQAPLVPYPRDPASGGHAEAEVVAQVAALARQVDVVVVSIHWGVEYAPRPLEADRAFARALADAGALLIIGHHPHVLQPVEWLPREGRPPALVAWSLGNLVSNQAFADAGAPERDGLLLETDLARGPSGAVEVVRVGAVPTATENRLGAGRHRNVQPVLLDEEFTAMLERLDELYYRHDAAALREQTQLEARLEVARARRARIRALLPPAPPTWAPSSAARVGLDTAPRAHPPTLSQ